MKYTIELTDAEREVICNVITAIRNNSLGEQRLFENTTIFKFDEKSTDYSAVYRKGIEDGNKIADKDLKAIRLSTYDMAYNKGLEDSRQTLLNLLKIPSGEWGDIFDRDSYYVEAILKHYSINEIAERIKAYEEKKKAEEESIKRGDEVKDLATDNIGVVMSTGKLIVYITNNGVHTNTLGSLEKTGRHFDEVEQLLDKLRGEE